MEVKVGFNYFSKRIKVIFKVKINTFSADKKFPNSVWLQ